MGENTFNERITSTYVENTGRAVFFGNIRKDHLHIRGEYKQTQLKTTFYMGSPPHTWRIHITNSISGSVTGITSTYVENTFAYHGVHDSTWDHLHIRGEYSKQIPL